MRILTIAFMLLLSACSIRFPQVENIVHALQDKPPAVENYRWQLNTESYSQSVLAVATENGLVFANNLDDAMLFDGTVIRRVVKIGADKNRYEIVDIDQAESLLRQMFENSEPRANHLCGQWQKQTREWRQSCRDSKAGSETYTNILGFNAQGELNNIEQVINASGTRVQLKKHL